MVAPNILNQRIDQAKRRIRVLLTFKWTARLLCIGLGVSIVWFVMAKLRLVQEPSAIWLGSVVTFSALVGFIGGLTRKITTFDTARLVEDRAGMKERFSSAIEFGDAESQNPIIVQQQLDASNAVSGVDLKRAFPFRMARETIFVGVAAALLFGAFFLPTLPIFWSKEKIAEIAEVKKAGLEIEKIAVAREKAASEKKLEETRKAAIEAKRLAEAMKRGGLSKKNAMIQLTKLTKNMEELQKKMAQENTPATKPMSKAADEAKKALSDQQKAMQDAAKQEQATGEKGKKPQNPKTGERQGEQKSAAEKPSESMKEVQKALQKFAQALSDQNAEMQNQAMKELAKEMEHGDMKQNEMKQLMQELQAMSQALQGSKLQTASNKMSEASKQMQGEGMKLKLDPETLKKLAKMMREAGEACKGGGKMTLDAEKLAELLQALKEGRLKLSSGSGMGLPIPLPGMGGQKGNGSGGKGYKGTPNNSDLAGLPKTVAVGKSNNITADSRASKEFLKYAAMGHKDSKFKPNTQVKGAWNNSHSELQQQFKGDPDSGYVAGTPLYDANQTGVRAIENPVAREQIPAAYRRQVKDYFQAITGNK